MVDSGSDFDRLYFVDHAEFEMIEFPSEGWVLDVCGGGEGIIGRMKGSNTVSIDRNLSELIEAPKGPLKIQMNAGELMFLDKTFSTAAMFFGLMFIPVHDHQQVLKEIYRVLQHRGKVYVWDGILPTRNGNKQPYVAIRLKIHLNGKVIETSYGTQWPPFELNSDYYCTLATEIGFKVVEIWRQKSCFMQEWRKP